MTQFYSKLYYVERIKSRFDAAWAVQSLLPPIEGAPKVNALNIRNIVTKEAWDNEAKSFRDRLTAQRDVEHLAEMAKFGKNKEISEAPLESAESYHK